MLKRSSPLFSRPVLAAIMVLSTLAVWLLNLTAPTPKVLIPELSVWQSKHGIPITWLEHAQWQNGDKLVISLDFAAPTAGKTTEAMLALLLADSLPLSTATLNQRLSASAAKVESSHNHQRQRITLTLSSQDAYLQATFKVMRTWWQQTQLKERSLTAWQQQQPIDTPEQQLALLMGAATPAQTMAAINFADVNTALTDLKHNLKRIVISGAAPAERKEAITASLEQIFVPQNISTTPEPDLNATNTLSLASTVTLGDGDWHQSLGAIPLSPLSDINQWFAMQIWITDALNTQKTTLDTQVSSWRFVQAPTTPFVTWRALIPEGSPFQPDIASAWLTLDQLPSLLDDERFDTLNTQLKSSIERYSLDPSWWATTMLDLSTNTRLDYPTTLTNLATHLADFDQDTYQAQLPSVLHLDHTQQVQVFQ